MTAGVAAGLAATGFFATGFFATGFFATGFLATGFFAMGFLATGFFAAGIGMVWPVCWAMAGCAANSASALDARMSVRRTLNSNKIGAGARLADAVKRESRGRQLAPPPDD